MLATSDVWRGMKPRQSLHRNRVLNNIPTAHVKARLHELWECCKGAFTRVPQVDQRGWINQGEPCKLFLSTEVINGVESTKVNRANCSFQRKWSTGLNQPRWTVQTVPFNGSDQRGWINQGEPCKLFLSTEVINGVDGWTSWRWPTFVQRRRFTLGDSPQIARIKKQVTTCSGVCLVLLIWLLNFVN